MDRERSTRFLNAFAEIEQYLRKQSGSSTYESFGSLLRKAEGSSKPIKMHRRNLEELADLRNAIVHERKNGEVIAEPHLDIVKEIEAIKELVTRPPAINNKFLTGVSTCTPNDSVIQVLQNMFDNSYSQMPVYDEDGFLGLLTTDAIARWLTRGLQADGFVIDGVVGDALNYRETEKNVGFIGRNDTLYDVIDCFEKASLEGLRLDALIINNSGRIHEKPLGILTTYDLPAIYGEIIAIP